MSGTTKRAGTVAVASALVGFALAVAATTTPVGSATSPDSLQYFRAAASLADGQGLAIGQSPLTAFAPLYPTILAAFMGGASSPEFAAARVSALGLVAIGLTVAFALRRLAGSEWAIAAAVVFIVSMPIITVFTYAWSETVAIPLLLFAIVWTDHIVGRAGGDDGGRQTRGIVVLCGTLVALVLTRYAAAPFALLLLASWWRTRDHRGSTTRHAVATIVWLGVAGSLAIRNFGETHSVTGGAREPSDRGVLQNLEDLVGAMVEPFVLRPVWALACVVTVALIAVWCRRGGSHEAADEPSFDAGSGSDLARLSAAAALVYAVWIVVVRSVVDMDPIDTRLAAPAFACGLLALLATVATARGTVASAHGRFRSGLQIAMMSLLAFAGVHGLTTLSRSSAAWVTDGSPRLPMTPGAEYNNLSRPVSARMQGARASLGEGDFSGAIAIADGDYDRHDLLATAYAGLGDAARAVEHARACIAIDRSRARVDILAMSRPFWTDRARFVAGVHFYEALARDLPDEGWLHRNISTLAQRLGDRARASEADARARALGY